MPKIFYTSLFAATFVLSLGACSDKKRDDVLAQDSSLDKDLALANNDTLAQPQLKDVAIQSDSNVASPRNVARTPAQILTPRGPVRRAPVRVSPPPVAPAPIPSNVTASGNTVSTNEGATGSAMGTIASGSTIGLYAGQRVCTNTNAVGDRFTASVAEAVQGSNGVTIPAGATVVLEITAVKRSTGPNDNIQIEMVPLSIGFNGKTYPMSSVVTYAQVDKVRDATRGDDVRKVATGAALGALAGQIFGHRTKSTVIGAAAGAAAGAIAASVTTPVDGCVPSGGRITLRLNQAVMVPGS